ncbi:uncharacterized protein TNCV_2812441 [Trichonephila clavipes]|nr:uncharacterized protein TNCV_2812441 [Trichonephila clavipes]
MAMPGSLFPPTPLGHEDNLKVRYLPRAKTFQWRPSRFNSPHPEAGGAAGLGGLQEVYFSGSENVEDFIEGIDNQIKLLYIPSDLSCAYLKGHLLGRARDWYEIFGSALVQNTATNLTKYSQTALTKDFPVVRNRKDLERLSMPEGALVDHIFVRLEPQVQDYVEAKNPKTTAQLLENESRRSDHDDRQRNWRNSEVLHRPSKIAEIIIGVIMSPVVKEISGSKAGMN